MAPLIPNFGIILGASLKYWPLYPLEERKIYPYEKELVSEPVRSFCEQRCAVSCMCCATVLQMW
jgi:hypothetical protein